MGRRRCPVCAKWCLRGLQSLCSQGTSPDCHMCRKCLRQCIDARLRDGAKEIKCPGCHAPACHARLSDRQGAQLRQNVQHRYPPRNPSLVRVPNVVQCWSCNVVAAIDAACVWARCNCGATLVAPHKQPSRPVTPHRLSPASVYDDGSAINLNLSHHNSLRRSHRSARHHSRRSPATHSQQQRLSYHSLTSNHRLSAYEVIFPGPKETSPCPSDTLQEVLKDACNNARNNSRCDDLDPDMDLLNPWDLSDDAAWRRSAVVELAADSYFEVNLADESEDVTCAPDGVCIDWRSPAYCSPYNDDDQLAALLEASLDSSTAACEGNVASPAVGRQRRRSARASLRHLRRSLRASLTASLHASQSDGNADSALDARVRTAPMYAACLDLLEELERANPAAYADSDLTVAQFVAETAEVYRQHPELLTNLEHDPASCSQPARRTSRRASSRGSRRSTKSSSRRHHPQRHRRTSITLSHQPSALSVI
ncbi:uncharacterized protein MONBRDRAFT_10499 [Monosiga brevicollis MX1]|uniref:Uncharacterized protein n=1 Tax=Monosiga brevicollis TaxID=81824 RepID=A9V6E0_MONBE|nr:uncharacterized protein MONBRDRAFT_10499 [Monosiga brevicollis MX1]EDQ87049.1 predicted protein [Monosiga brevicollis MX1]|eukprot:XP_001748288.1 hypothetical protein [Monosiga brevicollis MX1]